MANRKITFLVTGGGGYLGSVMVPMLLNDGHKVIVLDRFFWGREIFSIYSPDALKLIEADTRSYPADYLRGVDVVVDLAALSNDPLGEINPAITLDINYRARVRTALMAKSMGVKKYLLASSCSVYGFSDNILDENSTPSPITTYAQASLLAERGVLELSDRNFCVTALRQGTLYGISPRMRFDLLLNTMTLSLFKNNRIMVEGGDQWRPIVHVADSAAAFVKMASADSSSINGQVFNLGSSRQNYRIKDLACIIASTLNPARTIIINAFKKDTRSYRVSFTKIEKLGIAMKRTPRDTAIEIFQTLQSGAISDIIQTRTIDWYKHLLSKNPEILYAKEPKRLITDLLHEN